MTAFALAKNKSAAKPRLAGDEVKGEVKRVTFRNDDSGFCILELASGHKVLGNDPDGEINVRNGAYRFFGRWDEQSKWGRQFKFDLFVQDVASHRQAVVAYLVDNAPGVGVKRAEALFDRYGPDAVAMLRTNPSEVAAECGLEPENAKVAATALADLVAQEEAKIELFRLLDGRGFSRKLPAKIIRAMGKNASPALQRDPFKLHTMFKQSLVKTDRLYIELGHDPASMKRQVLWAVHGANGWDGSTWIPREKAEESIHRQCGKNNVKVDPARAIHMAVRAGMVSESAIDGVHHLAIRSRASAEELIADAIHYLSDAECVWPTLTGEPLSEHQHGELAKATAKPVGLFLGSPGTGKTFSVAEMVKAIIATHGANSLLVMAPTGKAAVRCTAAMQAAGVDVRATTIHKALEFRPSPEEGGEGGFQRGRDCPFDQKFVIVDESSMIDTSLCASLFRACTHGTHVLFIGDPYQLPPVGHGAPLRDMRDAGVPCGLLTEIRRNAGLIVEGCARIKDGFTPTYAAKIDLETGQNLRLVNARVPADQLAAMTRIIEAYSAKHLADATQPHPVWGIQVLVAANAKSELSRKPVNDVLQQLLNGHAATMFGIPFRVADKIICLRNGNYPIAECTHEDPGLFCNADYWTFRNDGGNKGRLEHYVANGEIGETIAIGKGSCVFKFDDPERFVRVFIGRPEVRDDDDNEHKGRGCNFDLAYAVTCHKSQGSQWPVVIVLLDEGAGLIASREWHYTAISRAEKTAFLVGRPEVLEKQIRRQSLRQRTTQLVKLIQEKRS